MNAVSIDKEAINQMPRVSFQGRIHVIDAISQVKSAVAALRTAAIVGFDTETRPAFKKGTHHKCALLQVATEDCCFLFRLNHMGLAPAIVRLLSDKQVTKVGLAWNNDLLSLRQLGSFEPGDFIDLQDMVREIGIEDQSLVKIFANLFYQHISKRERLSNWERDILTDAQKCYAAIDAWACVKMYHELRRLIETGDYKLIIVPEESSR